MKRRIVALMALMAATIPVVAVPQTASAGHGAHVFWIQGQSTVQNQTRYATIAGQWDQEVAGNGPAAFGIPKPTTLPPSPTSGSCSLMRNTGPAGLNPPCAGTLTHATLPGPQGCTEATNPVASCSFSGGTTWYYGYCGQTYGGAQGITFSFSGQSWTIEKMGFRRPSGGVWEFNGRMRRGTATAFIRMYLSAVPNNPDEAAACDVTANLTSIYFQGVAIVTPTQLPNSLVRPNGWHWCDGTDGC